MEVLERDVCSRSPLISVDDDEVFQYVSTVMNEILAIHPFREGNGRTAFIIGNLIPDNSSQLIEPYFIHKNIISLGYWVDYHSIQHILIKYFQYIVK